MAKETTQHKQYNLGTASQISEKGKKTIKRNTHSSFNFRRFTELKEKEIIIKNDKQ